MIRQYRLASLGAALMLGASLAAPLAAQAPVPPAPASPPPTTVAPAARPAAQVDTVRRTSPAPSAVAPAARTSEPAPTPQAGRVEPPPTGATMRCKDGTWLFGAPAAARCDRNGGIAVVVPARTAPPPAPAPRTP